MCTLSFFFSIIVIQDYQDLRPKMPNIIRPFTEQLIVCDTPE